MILLLNKLHDEGTLQLLFKAGFISPKVFHYREIFLHYHKEVTIGVKKSQAIKNTADFFNINDRMVYRAVNLLNPATPSLISTPPTK